MLSLILMSFGSLIFLVFVALVIPVVWKSLSRPERWPKVVLSDATRGYLPWGSRTKDVQARRLGILHLIVFLVLMFLAWSLFRLPPHDRPPKRPAGQTSTR